MALTAWQDWANLTGDRDARLGCFDRWAAQQAAPSVTGERAAAPAAPTPVTITLEAAAVDWLGQRQYTAVIALAWTRH